MGYKQIRFDMKRFIILLLIFEASYLQGQDVSESLAVEVATQYYERVKNDNPGEHISRIRTNNQTRSDRYPELISPLGLAGMWLVPVDDGWVLVSSNTKTTPILAHYQTDRKPVYDLLAPGEKYLLDWYEHEIAYANDSCPTCERNSKWNTLMQERTTGVMQIRSTSVVSPLTNTRWGQMINNGNQPYDCNKVYNKFCPIIRDNVLDPCGRTPAGCPAVAIAQIMAYWKWPYAADVPTTSGGSTTDIKFYDWEIMPDSILNTTNIDEVNMVAGFLRDCGYMAHMEYGADGSGTSDAHARDALVEFGYNESTISLKNKWQTSGWQTLLQSELNAGRPVYYGGYNNVWKDRGHAFVLDGYDSEGKFHINFGWRSSGWDDYYQIDSINANSTNYNHWQSAIVGIQPDPYCGSGTILNILTTFPKFNYTFGGEMVLENNVMENVEHGELFSATKVRLNKNVQIKSGCNVLIAIKDVPCQSVSSNAPAFQSTSSTEDDEKQNVSEIATTTENSCAQKFFRNGQLLILRDGKTYNVTGQEVAQ